MKEDRRAIIVLTMNTIAFTVCFAVWMMNGVLITFLVDNSVFRWTSSEMGWLIGIPVLTGSIVRLPVGILTDKYGGRIVYSLLMLVAAVATYLLSYADSYWEFIAASLGFGISGASFAVGIAYTSVWFSRERQGTALGIFGAGNAGAALTAIFAPQLLNYLTAGGTNLEGWRNMPKLYALGLFAMAVVFYLTTYYRRVEGGATKTLSQRLQPLKELQVWRFGLYYFLVFGGFVALSQWLIPYYVNVYTMSVAMAGFMSSIFSLPSGVIRAAGGWASDKWGPRPVMYWVLGSCVICCGLLVVPRMVVESPGEGIMARSGGQVTAISEEEIVVGETVYPYISKSSLERYTDLSEMESDVMVFPQAAFWQEPAVQVGDPVAKRQLLARGVTHILVFIVGIMMGIGKAGVYKFIPEYFPNDVGVVGGIVGVVGGLGGFICPVIFGYLLGSTGIWTTCWMFFFVLSLICLLWMQVVVRQIMKARVPGLLREIEEGMDTSALSPDMGEHKYGS
jgi:NNP family nitrate/nitrite transporter-like MFS transporter